MKQLIFSSYFLSIFFLFLPISTLSFPHLYQTHCKYWGRILALVILVFPLSISFFSLVWRGTKEDTKIRFVTKAGDCFTPPGFNQVIIASLLYFSLLAIMHIPQILSSPKNPFFFFSTFLCFSSNFVWFYSFLVEMRGKNFLYVPKFSWGSCTVPLIALV